MALSKTVENTILSLKAQIGLTGAGKARYKSYSYSNVDTAATDADLYFVGGRLATLFQGGIEKITRQDLSSLVEEP